MSKKATKTKLNPKQELFCQLYASEKEFFGNGVQAYAEAYDIDLTKRGGYNTAKANANRLLTNADVLARINELIDITLNDAHVDKQLALVISQNADFSSKVAAIREYNKLKQRIIDKVELSVPKHLLVFDDGPRATDHHNKAVGPSQVDPEAEGSRPGSQMP